MENNKKNKFKVFMVLFVLLVLIAGSSYAVWRYNYNGTSNNTISSTDLSFRFLESNKEIVSIDNAVPMSDEDGIKQEGTGNVFDFEVKSKVGATTDVKYVASLEKISVDSGKTALNDSDVKVYIEDFNGNTVLKPTKISELNSYKLFEKLHRHSKDNSEISTKYKLKVWLDSEVDVFSLENKQYKFKINVKTEQKEQDRNQSYKLVYDLDGGTGSIADSTFKVGDKVTITSVVPTKEGYNFLGWSTKKNASSASYKAGDSVTLNDAYDGSVRLYAVWQGKTYTVKYDSNGGTGSMEDSVFKLATDVRLMSNKFTKENYTFIGWSTSKGGEVTYTNEAKVKDLGGEGDIVTLYAVWKSNTYTIKYDSNGGTGSMANVTYSYGESKKLTKNTFTKDGYTFIGWNTNKDASVVLYTDEQEVSGLSSNITLYAVWKVNEYNVNVVVQNGTVDVANKKVIEKQNGVFNLTPSDSNYKDASVSCTNDQTGIVKNNILTVSNVTKDTVCTVTYYKYSTVLYNDGTLILNEYSYNRESNTTKHGSVTKEYAPMDESNSYVFSGNSDRPWSGVANSVTSVIVGSEMEPTSTAYWFDSLYNMESGDFTNLNTSNVTNMRQMFFEAGLVSKKFSVFGLENWNTSNVTDMSNLFQESGFSATTWNIGDLSNWDVSNVTNMINLFSSAGALATTWSVGDLSSWDTSKVTNMKYMFQLAGKDATTFNLDLSKWDTSNVTDMSYMFDSAGKNATTFNLDLSNWDTSSVTNMGHIFSDAGSKATTWAVKIPKVTGSLSNTTSKWYGSNGSVYAEPAGGRQFTLPADVNVVVQDGSLASGETSTKSGWTGDNFTFNIVPNDSSKTGFVSCTNNQTGTFKNNVLTVSNVTSDTTCTVTYKSISTVLYNDGTLIMNELGVNRASNISTHGTVTKEYAPMDESNSYVFDTHYDRPWNDDTLSVKSVEIGSKMSPTATAYWFAKFLNLEKGDFTNLDTSKVTSMRSMFSASGRDATTFKMQGLSNWNTSSVTSMYSMFITAGSSATTWSIGDISNWDTSSVTDMSSMFSSAGYSATTWTVGDLSNWNTSSVTDMSSMFSSAGQNATTWSVKIPKVTGSLSNTTSKWYGSSESVYAEPATGKQFTLPVDVSVVVQDGVLGDGEVATKTGWVGQDVTFNIVPNDSSKSGFVSCTNNQTGIFKNNVLTVSNITSDTTCTVIFDFTSTVLYSDGSSYTLVINDLNSNIAEHESIYGSIAKQYDPLSYSNSYVFNSESEIPWYDFNQQITNVLIGSNVSPMSTSLWFLGTSYLINADFTNLDTSNVETMAGMFYGVGVESTELNLIGLNKWDTSNVTDMSYMFNSTGIGGKTLKLDLSNWNTSKVTNMIEMFHGDGYETFEVIIPRKTGLLSNTESEFYGVDDTIYANPATGFNFTLAN